MSAWFWIAVAWGGSGVFAALVLQLAYYFWKEPESPWAGLRSDPITATLILLLIVLVGPLFLAFVISIVIERLINPKEVTPTKSDPSPPAEWP